VGTIFEVSDCEFLADGRALLECCGRSRFTVQEHWVEDGTQGLHYAVVAPFEDAAGVERSASPPARPASPPGAGAGGAGNLDSGASPSGAGGVGLSAGSAVKSNEAGSASPAGHQQQLSEHSLQMSALEQQAMMLAVDEWCARSRTLLREVLLLAPQMRHLERHYGPMPSPAGGVERAQGLNDLLTYLAGPVPVVHFTLNEASRFSFWLLSFLPIPCQAKLQVLRSTNVLPRLQCAVEWLQRLIGMVVPAPCISLRMARMAHDPVPPCVCS